MKKVTVKEMKKRRHNKKAEITRQIIGEASDDNKENENTKGEEERQEKEEERRQEREENGHSFLQENIQAKAKERGKQLEERQ